jgi:hypothetical protein
MQLAAPIVLCLGALTYISARQHPAFISDTPATYQQVVRHNEQVGPLLESLCNAADFFKYYKVNLFSRECKYFTEEGAFCGNRACAVDTLEEEDVPEIWRASVLGGLTGPSATAASELPLRTHSATTTDASIEGNSETCVQDSNISQDRGFCIPEDEGSSCVYVSLVDNEERYTGYHGKHAHAIWGAIYRENCFDHHVEEVFHSPSAETVEEKDTETSARPVSGSEKEFSNLLQDPVLSEHGIQDTCVEKRIFYRIISGMHASISTHICASYLDQLSGTWRPNMTCFQDRLAPYPDRLSNIYFNYVLLSRAIAKIGDALAGYTFCSGDINFDRQTSAQVQDIVKIAAQLPYDETSLFEDRLLKEDFRNRFRNISALMDCVGCDKCRLWGKVQVVGYGTALKILFDEAETLDELDLRQGELVALFNTYGRLSHSLAALDKTFAYTMPESDEPIPVDDPQLSETDALPINAKNPKAKHAGPRDPFSKLREHTGWIVAKVVALGDNWLTRTAFWRSFSYELSEMMRAFKFIFKSYIDLPRNIWYKLFVLRQPQDSTFWKFMFENKKSSEEL